MRKGEIFEGEFRNPVMELDVTHRDRAALLTVEGVANIKVDVVLVAVMGEVWSYWLYSMKRASHHSCVPGSVPLTVDSCTSGHAPVFVVRRSQRASWTGPPAMV